jgi:hypothetical protein
MTALYGRSVPRATWRFTRHDPTQPLTAQWELASLPSRLNQLFLATTTALPYHTLPNAGESETHGANFFLLCSGTTTTQTLAW